MRLVRAEMLRCCAPTTSVLARARGLSNRAIPLWPRPQEHAGACADDHRSATGGLIAFAIITETVFQWPGMGLLFIQAVTFADIP